MIIRTVNTIGLNLDYMAFLRWLFRLTNERFASTILRLFTRIQILYLIILSAIYHGFELMDISVGLRYCILVFNSIRNGRWFVESFDRVLYDAACDEIWDHSFSHSFVHCFTVKIYNL